MRGTMHEQMGDFREIDHDADIGLAITGADFADLFKTAAGGMFSLLVQKGQGADALGVSYKLELDATSREDLLVAFLTELLYRFESDKTVAVEVEFDHLQDLNLRCRVSGHMRSADERILNEIKSVTYHNLKIEETKSGLQTVIIFDV